MVKTLRILSKYSGVICSLAHSSANIGSMAHSGANIGSFKSKYWLKLACICSFDCKYMRAGCFKLAPEKQRLVEL